MSDYLKSEQIASENDELERENAIRRAWCYICSLAYTPRLVNPSFPAALPNVSLCADCLEEMTYERLVRSDREWAEYCGVA